MSESVAHAEHLLVEGLDVLRGALGDAEADLLAGLRVAGQVGRGVVRVQVDTVAALIRRGVFTERGQRADTAVAELLGIERAEARRLVLAADHVCPLIDLQGQVLPPLLPGTAAAFTAGTASLRHVEVIARLLDGPVAGRLATGVAADVEARLAAHAGDYTPTQLHTWGVELIELLDADGAEPDGREPEPVDEFFLARNANGSGGRIKGRIDSADLYDLIASVIDAKAAPRTGEDTRSIGQRQADALAEVFGYVADHADTDLVPAAGGARPHINVHVRLEDLEGRARAGCLDFGGITTPDVLRRLCCDASVIPIVLGGTGQPLDVGRSTRTIPDGLRRAVTARDRGCAHPGCDRGPSWCQIHHVIGWEHGGKTALANLVMLCRLHHREIHSSGWEVLIGIDGLPEFYPPAWIDPFQRPRRRPRPTPAEPDRVDGACATRVRGEPGRLPRPCPPVRAAPGVGPGGVGPGGAARPTRRPRGWTGPIRSDPPGPTARPKARR